jgi:1,4-alpha-glucan branching enzyme
LLVVCNFTPMPQLHYRIGVSRAGFYEEVLNTDAERYGGGNLGNLGGVNAEPQPCDGQPYSLTLTVPPLAALFFRWQRPL